MLGAELIRGGAAGVLRRLYDWTITMAGHRRARPALAVIAFAESSVFPIPPDVLLIPMVLADRDRAFRLALICTVASVLGGCLGYAIGYFLFEAVGRPMLEIYGYGEQFGRFQQGYNEYGAWIVAFFGVTPFPYKVITIASGVTGLDFLAFAVASLLSRAARFYLVAALLWRFGVPIRAFIERYLGLLTVAFFVLLVAGFVAVRYLL